MNNQTVSNKFLELGYARLCEAFEKTVKNPANSKLSTNDFIMMMLSHEDDTMKSNKINKLIKQANLSQMTSLDDIKYDSSRNINKLVIERIKTLDFIKNKHNIIIAGATGCGKSYLGTAIGFEACKNSPYDVIYYRLPGLLQEIVLKKDKGIYKTFMRRLRLVDLLIIDDLGVCGISIQESREILEILETRNEKKSTILISQLPFENWYEMFKDPTIADAIIDRIAYNSIKLELKGESMRKNKFDLNSYTN
jgi:DNA replication protein DnaC